MGKPELGTKRICPSCGAKYYDLNRNPIVCPSCGKVFEAVAHQRAPERVVAAVKPEKVVATEAVVEREEGIVSLEEAEAEVELDVGPDLDEEEEVVVPEAGVEVDEAEIEAEDSTFLPEEEEEGDDVAGLLDVDAETEDER